MESTVTAPEMVATKGKRRLVMVTATDEPSARLADRAGVDLVLVGDSLAMAALGRPDTLSVTLDGDDPPHPGRSGGRKRALLVADMPFGSYQTSVRDAVRSAVRLVAEGGARAVKLEGPRAPGDRRDRRRRNPGGRPPGPDAPVVAQPWRVPRPGPRPRAGFLPHRAGAGDRGGRGVPPGARGGPLAGRGGGHARARHPHDRHRRRTGLRRSGAGVRRPRGALRAAAPTFRAPLCGGRRSRFRARSRRSPRTYAEGATPPRPSATPHRRASRSCLVST